MQTMNVIVQLDVTWADGSMETHTRRLDLRDDVFCTSLFARLGSLSSRVTLEDGVWELTVTDPDDGSRMAHISNDPSRCEQPIPYFGIVTLDALSSPN